MVPCLDMTVEAVVTELAHLNITRTDSKALIVRSAGYDVDRWPSSPTSSRITRCAQPFAPRALRPAAAFTPLAHLRPPLVLPNITEVFGYVVNIILRSTSVTPTSVSEQLRNIRN